MRKLFFAVGAILIGSVLSSCGQKETSAFPGYEMKEEGLYVKYLSENAEGRSVQLGDVLTLKMKYTTQDDSVLFESQPGQPPVQIQADSGKFEGDFMGAFIGMHEGDSVSIIVNADTFFIKTAGLPESPAFVDSASVLYFTVKIDAVQSMEEMQQAQANKDAELATEENSKLQAYLTENNITTQPNPSGLIFISRTKGSGKSAEAGKKVKVNYSGRLLDGTYFDTSVEEVARENGIFDERRGYQPFEFNLGQGQVIQGWDEGIAMLKEGGKATLIIPSNLAYGANPRPGGPIKPFSTLIFEVELLEVLD